jgi:hypothetical protein
MVDIASNLLTLIEEENVYKAKLKVIRETKQKRIQDLIHYMSEIAGITQMEVDGKIIDLEKITAKPKLNTDIKTDYFKSILMDTYGDCDQDTIEKLLKIKIPSGNVQVPKIKIKNI